MGIKNVSNYLCIEATPEYSEERCFDGRLYPILFAGSRSMCVDGRNILKAFVKKCDVCVILPELCTYGDIIGYILQVYSDELLNVTRVFWTVAIDLRFEGDVFYTAIVFRETVVMLNLIEFDE
jgi:hypothetical protein